ncbi:LuxR C-terminal-related transcriptional regulator [Pseudomonas graminis]
MLTPTSAVAWLSLDEADAEPNRFLAYLILALDHAGLDLGHLTGLAESQSLDTQPQYTINALLRALAQENRRVSLFLDDYHTAANDQLDHIVQDLLEQAAPWLRWVVASRTRPGWPLATWKAKGWVHEMSARELSLTEAETGSILGSGIAATELQYLHDTTEGWAVAVQLARLWRASGDGSLYGLNAFSGCASDIAEYLTEQVFERLPKTCQTFLLETALLERFNAAFADAVRARSDSAQLLLQLKHLDALLVPLDAGRQWFRYHRLLRAFLSQRIDVQDAQRIHRAAALWLAQEKDWVKAVEHALQARDITLAVGLVVRAGGWELVLRHGIRYTQSLLRQFDEQTRRSDPDLLMLQAYLQAKLGDHALTTQLLQLARGTIHGDPRLIRDLHVIQTVANVYVDHFEPHNLTACSPHSGEVLIQATLECADALGAMSRGELACALHSIRSAHIKMRLVHSPRGENYCRIHEAQALALAGHIDVSHQLVDEALSIADTQFGRESSLRALVGCLKSQHGYWQGSWAEATAWLRDGWASLEHVDGWVDIIAATADVTWRMALRDQGQQPALRELERVARLATARNWPRLNRLVNAWRVDLRVQCGALVQARDEAALTDLEGVADHHADWRNHEAATLALARLQLASGASNAALTRLQRAGKVLQDKGLWLPAKRLELLALAAYGKDRHTLEPADLIAVFQHAPPGLLLEAGPCLLPALEACPETFAGQAAVLTRLRGWRAHPVRPREPFSAKETQILTLLASGQPNKGIAQALDISENTVKFHLKHVYTKLAVDNRTAAIGAALRLGVIDPQF